MDEWLSATPVVITSFMASLVEFVEALTIVLAVGVTRGWRASLSGAALGLALLLAIVAVLGPILVKVPIHLFQLVIGTLLLLFGLRWLSKAILRESGFIALHDEAQAFEGEISALRRFARMPQAGIDTIGFVTAFKAVALEGIEVVAIVIGIGAGAQGTLIVPASVGAAAALVLVVALGLWLHRPLARVPENQLKFGVGVLLAAFGTFWAGEGVGIEWPGSDFMLLGFAMAYLVLAFILVSICRRRWYASRKRKPPVGRKAVPNALVAIAIETWGLFVDDTVLAVGILLSVAAAFAAASAAPFALPHLGGLFAMSLAAVLSFSTIRRAK